MLSAVDLTHIHRQVDSSAIKSFQEAYSTLLRSSTVAFLRKRDKAKERRADKLLKDKRKKIEESKEVVKVTKMGSKRGAGRRKRQQARAKAQSLRRERSRAHAANTSKGADGVHAGSSATTGAHTTTK
jgi:signal recognition particle subunit SRP14